MSQSLLYILISLAILLAGLGLFYLLKSRKKARLNYHGFAESKYLTVDGFKIHYVQEGKGPDLILVHGIASSIFCWYLIFPKLIKNYRVTALDLPGFGLSDKIPEATYTLDTQAERLRLFLDALKIKDSQIIAHSMGGAIVAWFTCLYPSRVKKVLFIAPALNHELVWINPERFMWLIQLTKKFIVTPGLVKFIYNRGVLGKPKAETDIENAVMQYYLPFHESPDSVITFVKSTNVVKDQRLPAGISPFPRPAKILHGAMDRIVRRRYLDAFLKLNPQIELVSEPTSGHQLMEENPDFVLNEIKRLC